MKYIPRKDNYELIEHRLFLLLYIGRDQFTRGNSGFNLGFELGSENSDLRQAYEFLKKNGFISAYDTETVSDAEGTATFEKCKLTGKGYATYQSLESKLTVSVAEHSIDLR